MTRFDLEWEGAPYNQVQVMNPCKAGDWVMWEDVEQILQEIIDIDCGSASDDIREVKRMAREELK